MTDQDDYSGLRGLNDDLIALSASQLRNVDRLWAELDARVDEFRKLLDKPKKNEASRKALLSGTVKVDDDEYSVNKEFQETSTQLADALDLDELESARLLLKAQEEAEVLDRSILISAIIQFHKRREFLLECLRLTLAFSTDLEADDDARSTARELMGMILETKDGPTRNGSLYIRKCLQAMSDIEVWLQDLGDRMQGSIALGQALTPDHSEIMGIQQQSLSSQHASLACIVNGLVKAGYSGVEDFFKLLDHLPKIERWNNLAVHYVPIIMAFTTHYGSPEGNGTLREARMLNSRILDSKDSAAWKLRNFHAATITWWLAEYSGWYLEQPTGSPVQGVNFEAEALGRSESFFQALKDGGLQCTLSICSHITPFEWYDPAKSTLVSFLLREAPPLPPDLAMSPSWLRTLVMEQFETYADAFISNMPDTLRRFKAEEDDQRKRIHSNLQASVRGGVSEQELHLERFLLIISFSFDDRLEAAQSFWSDVDSNLYGFLQWASRRQSTPCVGAFCDMLRSISKTEECATSAHQFLLEESTNTSAKIRRSSSLSWAQIFGELSLYTSKIREQSTTTKPPSFYGGKPHPDEIDEPESVLMLESYLRLMSHLCAESTEVRSWILSQTSPQILDTLLYLCNSTVPSRLQSCAFAMIRTLLTAKSMEMGMTVWGCLDQWLSGAYAPSTNITRSAKITNPAKFSEEATFSAIASDFEQSNEFVALLQSLMAPSLTETGLNDQLPFPEALGSAYRMPGIEPYVDLVLDKIFATLMPQLDEPLKHKILAYNVLSFVVICLSTFNENLVVLANKSTIPVDEAMRTSSLSAYVSLHPFCRVMDWMFNERVLAVLFSTMHKDIDEVSRAPPDSPLVLALIRGIEAMNLIIDLQPTYLDIVRPQRKLQPSGRKKVVFSPSLASFEDSVALHLDLIVDLGRYSGVGNQDLTVGSLKLLDKLASSRILNVRAIPGSSDRVHGNRLIGIMEQNNDLEPIRRSLGLGMQLDPRELEQGPTSVGWTIKSAILEFLVHNLSASPDRPTLAHAILGFSCTGSVIDMDADSLFANSLSLFHSIVHLVAEYPDGNENNLQFWALNLRQMAMEVLSILWKSPLTSTLVLAELRKADLLFVLLLRQAAVDSCTEWDSRSVRDPGFIITEAAQALHQFLLQRDAILQYTGAELRFVALEDAPSLKARIFSSLLGSTSLPDGQQVPNLTIFDCLDFMELDIVNRVASPTLSYFKGLDFDISKKDAHGSSYSTHELRLVEEMIVLRLNELRRAGRLQDVNEEQQVMIEVEQITQHFRATNNEVVLKLTTRKALTTWTDLLILTIDTCDLEQEGKTALILQALQIITPKLESYALNSDPSVIALASLVQALMFQLDFRSSALDKSRAGDVASDRLFQVFRTALRAITGPEVGSDLREVLYKICYRYLTEMRTFSDNDIRRRHGINTVKATGEKTMDVICDDAYGASATCRISALLLLDALAVLAKSEMSNYTTDSLVRTNFLQILVEGIEDLPLELRGTSAKDIPMLLTFYESKLSLLLEISQSKVGAVQLLNAGLFQAVRASGLFAVDPDIGIEIDNPEALAKYYKLLLFITRVITSAVLSRGPQNNQTIESARAFLSENRALVVAVFKRQARIGGISFDDAGVNIEELVELFVLLISMTDFLNYEEERDTQKLRRQQGFA